MSYSCSPHEARLDALLTRVLSSDSHTSSSNAAVQEISSLIASHGSQMSSKLVVYRASVELFIPVLQHPGHQRLQFVIPALTALLSRESRHRTALLAPLLDTISDQERRNPLREQLFQGLSMQLLSKSPNNNSLLVGELYQLVALALHATKVIDGESSSEDEKDLPPSVVSSTLHGPNGQQQRLETNALSLLQAYLYRYRSAATSFVSDTILQPLSLLSTATKINPATACPICSYQHNCTAFLNTLHSGTAKSTSLCADILCLQLPHLPWKLWLTTDGTFRNRITQGIESLLRICFCRLNNRLEKKLDATSLGRLAVTLLCKVPLHLDEMLQQQSMGLISWANTSLQQVSNSSMVSTIAREILVDSIGGKNTPEGSISPMSPSLKRWLESDPASTDFISTLVSQGERHHRLVGALLRSKPTMIVDDEILWRTLQRQVSPASVACMKLSKSISWIEELLIGRERLHEEQITLKRKIGSLVFPLLQTGLGTTVSTATRVSTCNACGHLLPLDWAELGIAKTTSLMNGIMVIAMDGDLSVKLQTAGCKSMGCACDHMFSDRHFSESPEGSTLLRKIMGLLPGLCSAQPCSVRCMALFAMGNVAQILIGRIVESDAPVVVSYATICVSMLRSEQDEKVVANVIRTAGHVLSLLVYHGSSNCSSVSMEHNDRMSSVFDFAEDVIIELVGRLHLAVKLAGRDGCTRNFGCNKRTAVKKHGTGACNALAEIFRHRPVAEASNRAGTEPLCRAAIQGLLSVFQSLTHVSNTNPKLVVSASRALCSLEASTVPTLVDRDGSSVLRNAVLSSVAWLQTSSNNAVALSSQREAVESVLMLLLRGLTSHDASYILKWCYAQSLQPLLSFLVRWMTDKQCSCECFVPFALAIQMPSVNFVLDVSVEQQFFVKAVGLSFDVPHSSSDTTTVSESIDGDSDEL